MAETRESSLPWLTMVHGFSQNRKVFAAQRDHFADRYRVHTPDLKGHGDKADDPGPFGIRDYADDIRAELAELGITRTHFWGTHTGAGIGLLLALEHPELVASLILEAPVIPGEVLPVVADQMASTQAILAEAGLSAALDHWFGTSPWFQAMQQSPEQRRADEHRRIVLEFRGAPFTTTTTTPAPQPSIADRFESIRQPSLIYSGADDAPDFLAAAARMHEGIPHSEREIFPELGGFPAWEDPAQVNARVERFLARLEATPTPEIARPL